MPLLTGRNQNAARNTASYTDPKGRRKGEQEKVIDAYSGKLRLEDLEG